MCTSGALYYAAKGALFTPGSHAGLRLHLVEHAVIAEEHLADVHTVIQRRDQEQQRQQATARAGAAPRASHHCDCAPSTIDCTSLASASLRPSRSAGGV